MIIKWTAEQREVPNLGIFVAGDSIDAPDKTAKALIDQGLAIKAPAPKKIAPKEGE
jgi:hypothetical protein